LSERCIVRVKFTPAGAAGEVRRAVGGFLRYVQHRDFHPDSEPTHPKPEVTGLLKYVAYRDKASSRAELFGPNGPLGSKERKEFAELVARSIEGSEPQLFRTRDGRLMDRRRAVSRFVISPERAQGLDLEALTRSAVSRLESDMGLSDLGWIAAIHRNTRHHHVHLVLAGMHGTGKAGYRRVDVGRSRLAGMKDAVALEIERQRGERMRARQRAQVSDAAPPALLRRALPEQAPVRITPAEPLARSRVASSGSRSALRMTAAASSVLRLRTAARRYQRQMQRQVEEEAWRLGWERAA
jgi:hypothetical protein